MYICNKCKEVFDETHMRSEVVFESDGYQKWGYVDECPECGSEDFEEAVDCDLCGEWIPESKRIWGGVAHVICPDCAKSYFTLDLLKEFALSEIEAWAYFLVEKDMEGELEK